MIIIHKSLNTHCGHCELFSLCTEYLPNCYCVVDSLFSRRTGPSGNTFPVLFQVLRFLIYSEKFVHNASYLMTPKNHCLIRWRLFLNGFRSVLVNATDKHLELKVRFVSRALVPSYRATCTIASRVNFFNTKKFFLILDFEVWI